MATQGPYYTNTVTDVPGAGPNWFPPENARLSDDSRALVSMTFAGLDSHQLQATDFQFTVPAGSTIDGITVEIEKRFTGVGVQDRTVKLIKNGAVVGTNKASGSAWGGADAFVSYGGGTDLWGETWSVADINATNFGVALVAFATTSGTSDGEIDSFRITVTYTAPAVTSRSIAPSLLGA